MVDLPKLAQVFRHLGTLGHGAQAPASLSADQPFARGRRSEDWKYLTFFSCIGLRGLYYLTEKPDLHSSAQPVPLPTCHLDL